MRLLNILGALLCGLIAIIWLVKEPSYEPAIVLISDIILLLSYIFASLDREQKVALIGEEITEALSSIVIFGAIILIALSYAVSPIDFLPDALPCVGYSDDLGIMGVILWYFNEIYHRIYEYLQHSKIACGFLLLFFTFTLSCISTLAVVN